MGRIVKKLWKNELEGRMIRLEEKGTVSMKLEYGGLWKNVRHEFTEKIDLWDI